MFGVSFSQMPSNFRKKIVEALLPYGLPPGIKFHRLLTNGEGTTHSRHIHVPTLHTWTVATMPL
jgi:hypothetical protein